ncbi:MAG: hypothetical protein V1898_02130 [Patescibacteria group bacterium]
MSKKKSWLLKIFFISIVIFTPLISMAGTAPGFFPTDQGAQETDLNLTAVDIFSTVSRLIYYALSFLGLISLILVLYAGFLWMMARGNQEEITKAKDILKGGFIGMVIILASYGISYFVFSTLLTVMKKF